MSEFFTYEFRRDSHRIHVHFVPPEQTEPHRVVERYVDFQKNHGSPDELIFLGFEFSDDVISEVLKGDDLQARRPTLMPLKGGSFRGLIFRADGKLVDVITNAPVEITELVELRTQGMLAIFAKRSGMIETTPSFHYVKPSGQHVERFVRTSNTLVCGAEVNFMAAWLSPLLGPEVRVVHCDTSGIASLAHATIAIRGRFDGSVRVIAVDSFGSYTGLRSNSLRDVTSSVVLISASTSGNMARKIAAGGVPHSSVITVFYLGTEKPGHPVLCNLRDGGYEPVVNHLEADCPLCMGGSIALSEEDALRLHPWTYDELTDQLVKKVARFSQGRKYHKIRKILERDSKLARLRQLNPKNPKSAKQWWYSPNMAVEIEKQWSLPTAATIAAPVGV